MSKTVGLSETNPKMLELCPFPKGSPPAALLYHQALGFFRVFKKSFGDGSQLVLEKYHVPVDDLSSCIVNYHFAVELMLKCLISMKSVEKFKHHHLLADHLKEAALHHQKLLTIQNNSEYMLLLKELGENFDKIRYSEGTIFLRPNKKKGAKPLEELSKSLDDIFNILIAAFEEAVRHP